MSYGHEQTLGHKNMNLYHKQSTSLDSNFLSEKQDTDPSKDDDIDDNVWAKQG